MDDPRYQKPSEVAALIGSAFVLVELGGGTYHGVREGVTIYRVWPYPGEPGWGASYHSSGRFVAKSKTLQEMHCILAARCNTSNGDVSDGGKAT